MIIAGIILLGYLLVVWLLIRFFQAVHQWDDEIEAMDYSHVGLCGPTQKSGRVSAMPGLSPKKHGAKYVRRHT